MAVDRKITVISLIVLLALILGMGGYSWHTYMGGDGQEFVYELANGDMSGDVAVEMTVDPNGWQNGDKSSEALWGTQYNGVFYNQSSNNIKGWVITFDVPEFSYIDSDWNGVYTLENNRIRVECVDYNKDITAESSETFGMVMYTPSPITIDSFAVEVNMMKSPLADPIFWGFSIAVFTLFVFTLASIILSIKYKYLQEKMDIYHEVSEQAMKTFAKTIDAKDPYTSGHSLRVAAYSRAIAERMGFSPEKQENIYFIALLHDIGKISVPDAILNKPGKLTEEEYEQIKKHATAGGDILFAFSAIEGIGNGARYHHERYDGSGYGAGMRGEEIPICARIIGVADAYDAMSSARCYRPALSKEKVLEELENGSGTQFDPNIVKHMIAMIKEDKLPDAN